MCGIGIEPASLCKKSVAMAFFVLARQHLFEMPSLLYKEKRQYEFSQRSMNLDHGFWYSDTIAILFCFCMFRLLRGFLYIHYKTK